MSWLPNLTRRFKEIARNVSVAPHKPVPVREEKPVSLPNGNPILPSGIKAANEVINAQPLSKAQEVPPVTHPGPMRTSAKGLALIKSFESCAKAIGNGRFEAYPDPAPGNNGLPVTIGWGSTRDFQGRPIKLGTVWTQEQCDRKKAEDMAEFERQVRAILGNTPTTQGQFDALVSFAYNIGSDDLRKSTLMRRHKAGDHTAAAKEFARWNRAGGQVMRGLTRRRAAEAALYRGEK
jgi:GH24 family phage-related lysozyme (muramidase)